ncbi:MAG: hypothetical protein JXO22_14135 [Phycisphaerae bacterium]|nr:hypothetical protein [Phycisphaerae bacterium]
MRRKIMALTALGAALTVLSGCANILGAMSYYLSPEHRQAALYEPTTNALAIIIDGAPTEPDHPLFRQALHDKIVALFRENNVNDDVVPYADQLDLQQRMPDYSSLTIQRIGRELGVEQVIHLQITSFSFRDTPSHPLVNPHVTLRVKVVDCNGPAKTARLWPETSEGWEVECSRPAQEASTVQALDEAAAKLGNDTAQLVARLFYDHTLEERVPTEK